MRRRIGAPACGPPGSRTRATVNVDDGHTIGIAAAFPIDRLPIAGIEQSARIWFDVGLRHAKVFSKIEKDPALLPGLDPSFDLE
jgi:hypothetical protein